MVFAVVPSWRNWQTRMVQVHVPATVWGFESLRWHQEFRFGNVQAISRMVKTQRLGRDG